MRTVLTQQQIQDMSAPLPADSTYVVTNTAVMDAPLDFVWENLPKNVDISRIMRPYRGLPGAASWVVTQEFNEPGSNITYTMTDSSTIIETIFKRDPVTRHYAYGYLPPVPVFDFWQGNLFYSATPDGRTEVVWRYWLKPKDTLISRIGARLLKHLIWNGYTARGIKGMKAEVERLYREQA
ncbi:hypothetical protein ACWF94_25475 [Streptomyces sp. NPDC055078]